MGLFKRAKPKSNKYNLGMKKTRSGLMGRLFGVFQNYDKITEELFEDLTDVFIMADLGVETTLNFIDELKTDERVRGLKSAAELRPIIIDKMFELYLKQEIVNVNLNIQKGLSVFLFVGVNGTGKTTTIAKLAHKLKQEQKKVLLAAGDTFRAGAVDQLEVWANRIGVDITAKPNVLSTKSCGFMDTTPFSSSFLAFSWTARLWK